MGNGVLFVTVISTGKEAERSQRKRSDADDQTRDTTLPVANKVT